MNCPYCNNLLKEGYIYSPRTLCWTQQPLKSFSGFSFHKEGNVVLSETGLLTPAKIVAYNCSSCRRMIVMY